MGRRNNQIVQQKPKPQATIKTPSIPDESSSLELMNGIKSDLICCKLSSIYGRYLEAKNFIKKGTLIFKENVLVAGPMRSSDVVCAGCHKEIQLNTQVKTKQYARCSKCRWPICQEKCQSSIYHQNECNFFTRNNIQAPKFEEEGVSGEFGALTVLRALLLKITDPESWKTLNTLQHHNVVRKNLPIWKENQADVLDVIQNKWKLKKWFSSDEEIHTICGILEVNSFELGETSSFRGLFPQSAMFAHNCVPNITYFVHSEKGLIDIRAAADIPAGTPLFLTYALSLQGTSLRQKSLLDIKFFECACERCIDPTELGVHMSSLKCQKCKSGWLIRQNDLNGLSCDNSNCGQSTSMVSVNNLVQKFCQIWENLEKDIKCHEIFLKECEPHFHPNHYIPFRVKFDLCEAYGRQGVSSIHDLAQEDLERKQALCKEVLKVLDKITPGYTISRAWILYELQASELLISKQVFESGDFTTSILRKSLVNSMKTLLEAITIFEFCDASTVEYAIAKTAKHDTLPGLQMWIDCLK